MVHPKSRRSFMKRAGAGVGGLTVTKARPEGLAWPGHLPPAHFVLIHGAWHGAWCWYRIKTLLENAGHRVTVLDLPSHGVDATPSATVTLRDYSDRITRFLDTQAEPVILVGHSMGGIAISTAAEACPHKVAKLVYLSAFLLQHGQSLLDVALADAGSLATPNLIPQPELGIVDINRGALVNVFYEESGEADINLARALLKPNASGPLGTPLALTEQNFGSVRRFYISCLRDQAVTPAAQASMYNALPCERVFALDTDHSPFFSWPLRLASDLVLIAFA